MKPGFYQLKNGDKNQHLYVLEVQDDGVDVFFLHTNKLKHLIVTSEKFKSLYEPEDLKSVKISDSELDELMAYWMGWWKDGGWWKSEAGLEYPNRDYPNARFETHFWSPTGLWDHAGRISVELNKRIGIVKTAEIVKMCWLRSDEEAHLHEPFLRGICIAALQVLK